MSAPAWAAEVVTIVCADAGVAEPLLTWRRRRGAHSTGITRRREGIVSVRAGDDSLDQRLTLLHELAHWLAAPARPRRGRTIHHGRAFYHVAFDLYRRHGIGAADALRLEGSRYPSALRHAASLGVPGAASAVAERRAVVGARPRRRWRVLVPEHRVRLVRDGRWTVCAVCRQRVVGASLGRMRRSRRPVHHVLLASTPVSETR